MLPEGIPTVYRGGPWLTFKPHEVKIDRRTGRLKLTHGVSVDSEASRVVEYGGAYAVRDIPSGLRIIQRGQRTSHFEIVPVFSVTPEQYQLLLDQVVLELVEEEP
jgi:hypothetical protein